MLFLQGEQSPWCTARVKEEDFVNFVFRAVSFNFHMNSLEVLLISFPFSILSVTSSHMEENTIRKPLTENRNKRSNENATWGSKKEEARTGRQSIKLTFRRTLGRPRRDLLLPLL
jgi:hypothetical protein